MINLKELGVVVHILVHSINPTDFDDLKLRLEILQSRVDTLRALANTQKVSFLETEYSCKIEHLKRELCEEREKHKEWSRT